MALLQENNLILVGFRDFYHRLLGTLQENTRRIVRWVFHRQGKNHPHRYIRKGLIVHPDIHVIRIIKKAADDFSTELILPYCSNLCSAG